GPKATRPHASEASSSTTRRRPAPTPATPPPETELFRILCRQAETKAPALIEARQPNPDVSVTYRALLAHAQALRARVIDGEIATGDVVAVLSQRPLHQTVAIIAGIA